MTMRGSSIEIRLPSELGVEKVAMNTASSLASMMGFPENRVEDLRTALAEACINAIEHGNKLDGSLTVGVVLSSTDDALEVKVLDDGGGINGVAAAPDIDRKLLGEETARGMGLYLIRALVDEAEWYQGPPGQSYVRLVIRLNKEEK